MLAASTGLLDQSRPRMKQPVPAASLIWLLVSMVLGRGVFFFAALAIC